MTVTDMWDLISAGGATATLLIVVVLLLREDLTPGSETRRERARADALNQQAAEVTLLTKRLLDLIEDYTRHQQQGGSR